MFGVLVCVQGWERRGGLVGTAEGRRRGEERKGGKALFVTRINHHRAPPLAHHPPASTPAAAAVVVVCAPFLFAGPARSHVSVADSFDSPARVSHALRRVAAAGAGVAGVLHLSLLRVPRRAAARVAVV